jgi:hypothetical protein
MKDKSLPFYRIIKARRHSAVPGGFARGFAFATHRDGDEQAWGEIKTSVQDFAKPEVAVRYFNKAFSRYSDEVKRRTFFIEKECDGEKVVTFTARWGDTGVRRHPFVRWGAAKEPYQEGDWKKQSSRKGSDEWVEIEGVAPCISRQMRDAIRPSTFPDGTDLTLRPPNPCRAVIKIKRRWRL